MHGDHIIGLPGLLFMMSLLGRKQKISIYGPPNIINYVRSQSENIGLMPNFDVYVHEINQDWKFIDDEITITAFPIRHSVTGFGYSLIYKKPMGKFHPELAIEYGIPKGHLWGKIKKGESVFINGNEIRPEQICDPAPPPLKITYTGDTAYFDELVSYAQNSDILISESMYSEAHRSLAIERYHMTASDAAQLAKKSNANLLILTHISPRYEDPQILLNEAKEIFENTIVAYDLMKVKINKSKFIIF